MKQQPEEPDRPWSDAEIERDEARFRAMQDQRMAVFREAVQLMYEKRKSVGLGPEGLNYPFLTNAAFQDMVLREESFVEFARHAAWWVFGECVYSNLNAARQAERLP